MPTSDQRERRDAKTQPVGRRHPEEKRRQVVRERRRERDARWPGRRSVATLICFNATPITAARLAPNALRTASSRDRCVTLYDNTPNRPAPAISNANTAKPPSSTA